MRILVFAYACEPGKGSEPEVGWLWSRMLARIGDIWVITRANNRPLVEEHLGGIPERDRMHFVFVDLPSRTRWWKRGQRGIRLYYLLWQLAALREARRLHADVGFDLAWHLTLANAWLGSVVPLLDVPFVYGPVGGGVTTPPTLLPSLGVRGLAYEAARRIARGAGRHLNPLSRLAWSRARLILVQSSPTRAWLPSSCRKRTHVFPNVVLNGTGVGPSRGVPVQSRRALFAGRLLAWKGATLAVRAMADLPEWTLDVAGSGPDERRLRHLAARLGVEERVTFIGHVPHEELLELMRRDMNVLVFPSLHEDAGWVVVEAFSCGLPVVCLDVGGPPELGARAVPVSTPGRTVAALVEAIRQAEDAAPASVEPFSMDSREAKLRALLDAAGLLAPATGEPAAAGTR
jgi:glycosyltransferase involved in cell wall biosynthesis